MGPGSKTAVRKNLRLCIIISLKFNSSSGLPICWMDLKTRLITFKAPDGHLKEKYANLSPHNCMKSSATPEGNESV